MGKTPLEPRPRWEVREGTDTRSEWYNLSGVIQHEWFGSTSGSYTEEIGWGVMKLFGIVLVWKEIVLNCFGFENVSVKFIKHCFIGLYFILVYFVN